MWVLTKRVLLLFLYDDILTRLGNWEFRRLWGNYRGVLCMFCCFLQAKGGIASERHRERIS